MQRILIVLGVAALLFLLWQVRHAIVLTCGSIVMHLLLLKAAPGRVETLSSQC